MYSTSDVDMDNGSFSCQSLSGCGNSGIVMNNGFYVDSSSTGILNEIEGITTDNGISSDVPSSEPIHFSNEEK